METLEQVDYTTVGYGWVSGDTVSSTLERPCANNCALFVLICRGFGILVSEEETAPSRTRRVRRVYTTYNNPHPLLVGVCTMAPTTALPLRIR